MADIHDNKVQPTSESEIKAAEVGLADTKHVEHSTDFIPVYEEEEEVPKLHARTFIALAAFFLLNYTQVVALQGPATVVSCSLTFLISIHSTK